MIRRNKAAAPLIRNGGQAPQMYNSPTVAVANPGYSGVGNLPTDDYFSLEVDTTAIPIGTNSDIVLFDGSRGYQLATNYALPVGVNITGQTSDYQYMLNDVVHNAAYVGTLKLRICDPNSNNQVCDIAQFAHPIQVYDSSKGSAPRLLQTIYPEKGINEQQYNLSISTFKVDLTITNRTALVYKQLPGIKYQWSFYQVAELGRKQ